MKGLENTILELIDENIRLMDENIRLALENVRLKGRLGLPEWARNLFVENYLKDRGGDYVIVVRKKELRDNKN